MHISREAAYYNCLAVQFNSNYDKLSNLYARSKSWENAWMRTNALFPFDPNQEAAKLEKFGIHIALRHEHEFPVLLREIPLSPHAIYYKGILPTRNTISIVGTRKPTTEGALFAERMSSALAESGLAIVSGLAFGIDASAHQGTLSSAGATIAVLAHGLHTTQPARHRALAESILASGGGVLSEYPLETPALKNHFIARNRIISGLSEAVLIIEAPQRSGSLLTAYFAAEQGRTVMVVPGPANHPNFKGSHALIRTGAILVETANDVLEELGIASRMDPHVPQSAVAFDDQASLILGILRSATRPLTIDKISEATNLNVQKVLPAITRLLLANKIQETQNGISIL